jgi:CheY-like chemotaxis protein
VRLSVIDTGLGISSEIQSHIFEPFFTTKGPGVGTGLGLATVYGIVKQYRGFIQVDSAPGKGTRFDIYLPRHVAQPPQPTILRRPVAGRTHNAASVLVVEDEPQVLSLVTTLLRNLGYHVVAVSRAQEALELVRDARAQPDLLLTDVVMPAMNGVELVRALRAYRPELKSIFMSGYLSDARVNLDGDPSPILHKPFTLKAIEDAVHAALGDQGEPRDGLPTRS